MSDIGKIIHDEASEYELRDPDYTPTDFERAMLEDFGNGLVEKLRAALTADAPALSAAYAKGMEKGLSEAARDVVRERERQQSAEGWTTIHDDENQLGDMARAAACYALTASDYPVDDTIVLRFWPWSSKWWKPKDRRRDLVRAGALILAEIERLDRAAAIEARLSAIKGDER